MDFLKNKDIRNLALLWVLGTAVAVAWGAWCYYAPLHEGNPGAETPITSWTNDPASTVAVQVRWNNAWTVATITPFLFAPILTLLYVIVRFGKAKNPKAAHFHENLPLEVFWTIIPAVVLVAMAVPSYRVLRYMEYPSQKPDLFVDVVGAQFYWQYSFGKYDVTVVDDGVGDKPLLLPVDKVIFLNGQSFQVNHAWWVPAFGVKFDVIPNRITTAWFRPTKEGFFKGQCAELCGALHGDMLIHVKIVPEKEFYEWLLENNATIPVEEYAKVEAIIGREIPNKVPPPAEAETAPAAIEATES